MKILLAALALGSPLAPASAPAVSAPVPASDLDKLVLLMLPEQRVLDVAYDAVRNETRNRPGELAGDPAMADFVLKRMWPEVSKVMRDGLPELRADVARILSAQLSSGEIADIYTFFASATGQKLQNMIFEEMAKAQGTPEEQRQAAIQRFMESLSPGDYAALTRFGASAGAQKMETVTPLIGSASNAWAQRLLARHGARFDTLRAEAIAEYKRQKAAQ